MTTLALGLRIAEHLRERRAYRGLGSATLQTRIDRLRRAQLVRALTDPRGYLDSITNAAIDPSQAGTKS